MASLNTNGQDARQSGASSQFVVDSTGTDSQCARGRIVSSAASSTRPEGEHQRTKNVLGYKFAKARYSITSGARYI